MSAITAFYQTIWGTCLLTQIKNEKALRTFCEDTVIQLQHVGSQSTSRKCDELKQVSNR